MGRKVDRFKLSRCLLSRYLGYDTSVPRHAAAGRPALYSLLLWHSRRCLISYMPSSFWLRASSSSVGLIEIKPLLPQPLFQIQRAYTNSAFLCIATFFYNSRSYGISFKCRHVCRRANNCEWCVKPPTRRTVLFCHY